MQDFAYILVVTLHMHSAVTLFEAIDLSSEISHVALVKDLN